jgi:hypothetical protein
VVLPAGFIFYYLITVNIQPNNSILFDRPAVYTIRVQGHIDPSWSARLEGMKIRSSPDDLGTSGTTLIGEITDQSALAGVLNTLYEFHLPVISVERLDSPLQEK